MDTSKPTPKMVAMMVAKPAATQPSAGKGKTKRAFTPKPHLTDRPFAGLRDLLASSN